MLFLMFLRKRLVEQTLETVDVVANDIRVGVLLNWRERWICDGRQYVDRVWYIDRWLPLRSMRIFWTRD